MKIATTLTALALIASFAAQAQTAPTTADYIGRDGNWFNPANWSTGQVPGPGINVRLDGRDEVVIDPALGPADVTISDLRIGDTASLTTLPGVFLHNRDTILEGRAQLIHRSSASEGENLITTAAPNPCTGCGLKLNPNPKSKRVVVLQSSFNIDFGLGGREPASINKTGAGTLVLAGNGYYSTLTADVVVLGGDTGLTALVNRVPLSMSLYYGFRPRHGDSFQIITANRHLIGRFPGMPDGSLVGCTEGNVGFYITYAGGDGNDVVLSARDTRPLACLLLPAVQRVRESVRF